MDHQFYSVFANQYIHLFLCLLSIVIVLYSPTCHSIIAMPGSFTGSEFVIVIFPTAPEDILTLFFLDGLCVGDLLCRDVTDKERGGSKPLSSVMHFPFDSAAATESYFPAFLPLSVLFCVQQWNVLENSLNCKNHISLILFSLSLPFFFFFLQ